MITKKEISKNQKRPHVGLLCKKCGTFIFSRAGHDFRWCSCKAVAIDGGFGYVKVSGDLNAYKSYQITLPSRLTLKKLYEDWNKRKDKEGFYPKGKWPVFVQKAVTKS